MPRAELFTAREAADFVRVSVLTVRNWCKGYYNTVNGPRACKKLPHTRAGRKIIITRPDLERYVGLR